MAGTIPRSTAWIARSLLVQCVMCSPWAIGSKQASSTIWARCRGGNPGRTARSRGVVQQPVEPALAGASAGAADGLDIALHLEGHDAGALPLGGRQDRPRPADLIPRQRLATRDLLRRDSIMGGDRQGRRSSTTHRTASDAGRNEPPSIQGPSNFPLYFLPDPVGDCWQNSRCCHPPY